MGYGRAGNSDTIELISPVIKTVGDTSWGHSAGSLAGNESIAPGKWRGNLTRQLRIGAVVAALVLMTNVIWLAYGLAKYGIKDGYGIISEGLCESVKQTDIWLHLLINVLSTCLQTASNACMGAYCSPSRKEVDKAHKQKRWLHIGIFSFRNFSYIAQRKALVVSILAVSSIPFHLLYNSMVFTSLYTNTYYYSVVTSEFANGAAYNFTGSVQYVSAENKKYDYVGRYNGKSIGDPYYRINSLPYFMGENDTELNTMRQRFEYIQQNMQSWQRLSLDECISAYSNVVVSDRRHVVLVSSERNDTNSILRWGERIEDGSHLDSNYWICSMEEQMGPGRACNPRSYLGNATWDVWGHPIDHCLSERKDAVCKVQFSLSIMIVAIVFNIIKLCCMIFVLVKFNAEHLLATVGDAAASFLQREDDTTKGMCLAKGRSISALWKARGLAQPYKSPSRWEEAAGRLRWTSFFLLIISGIGIVVGLLGWGLSWLKYQKFSLDFNSLWSLGFGRLNQYTMVIAQADIDTEDRANLAKMALLANLPQIALALIYFTFSAILTAMFISADWSRFAFKAQTLLVSTLKSDSQRGTWFLGIPWKFGVVLIAVQVLLHWLTSQALFIAQIFRMPLDGEPENTPIILNCGFSPIATIFTVVAGFLIIFMAVGIMLRKFPKGAPPVVATNSAAISASCHPYETNESITLQPLRWGVWKLEMDGVWHCSLMPADVYELDGRLPREGELYS